MNRRLVIAALVALVIGGALLLVRTLVPDERFIFGVAAAGPTEALLLTRRNEDHSTAFWIEHVDLAGQLRWSVELSPLKPRDALGFTSVAAADDRIVVLGLRGNDEVALALDRTSGKRLWETVLPGAHETTGRIGPMVLIDGPRVYLVRETKSGGGLADRVDALSLADGATLWAFEPDKGADVYLLGPDRLLVSSMHGGASVLAGATGEVSQEIELTRVLCSVPEGLLATHVDRALIVPTAADRPVWHTEPDPKWQVWDGPCGARGEDLVLGVRDHVRDSTGLARIDRKTGLPRWQIDLGIVQSNPILTLDGRLPRFLPVYVYGSHGEGPIVNEIAIVDLDAGVVMKRATIVDHVEVLATAERAWLWFRFKNTLAGLDPATGLLTSATHFAGLSGADIRHDDLQFGALWLHGMGWDRPAALPWMAVDLGTGEVLRTAASIVPRDETAALRTMLGG